MTNDWLDDFKEWAKTHPPEPVRLGWSSLPTPTSFKKGDPSAFKGRSHTAESKELISEALKVWNKLNPRSDEQRARQSEGQRGLKKATYKKWSPEARAKLSASMTGKKRGPYNKRKD